MLVCREMNDSELIRWMTANPTFTADECLRMCKPRPAVPSYRKGENSTDRSKKNDRAEVVSLTGPTSETSTSK